MAAKQSDDHSEAEKRLPDEDSKPAGVRWEVADIVRLYGEACAQAHPLTPPERAALLIFLAGGILRLTECDGHEPYNSHE